MEVAQLRAAESCLQNSIIIQKILERLFPDSMENFNLRLLNTSFNSEILHRVRSTHRYIEMKYRKSRKFWLYGQTNEPDEAKLFYVNGRRIEADNIFDYMRFLKEVANVKVDELFMHNFSAIVSSEKWRKRLHDEIHNFLDNQTLRKFVGMSDLCPGFCTKCHICAGNSSEYGPLQIGISMDSFGNKRHLHFEKLIVDERNLHGTSSNIFMYVPSEDSQKFKLYMDPLISCDELCFKISEVIWKPSERPRSQPLPLEVIEEMCDAWKAKSIVLEFDFWQQRAAKEEKWSDKGIFTPIRFDEPYQETDGKTDTKKRKFSSVTIDMRSTKHVYRELINGLNDENISYSNLIANVGQVFPTDKIIIIGEVPQLPFLCLRFKRGCFENILKSIWKIPGHLEVTIRHDVSAVLDQDDFKILDLIDIIGRQLKCTILPERTRSLNYRRRRTFIITDEIGDKTLNLEVSLCTYLLQLAREGEGFNVTPLENGYLSFF